VQPILDRSLQLLQKILPVEDFTVFSTLDEIYVPTAQVDDENLLLDLAFDVVLSPTFRTGQSRHILRLVKRF
jgi:hypothetical protein